MEEEGKSSVFKRLLQFSTIAGAVGLLVLSWWLIAAVVTIDPKEWSMFFNAKLPLLIAQVTTVLTVIICFDLACKGWTIESILNIKETSCWQDKAVAAGFLVGMGMVISLAVKGGF